MSSAISFDPNNSEEVSISLNSKNAGDILNDAAKLPAEPAVASHRKGSDISDAETLDDISESSLLENDEVDSNVSNKTYQIKSAPEISPLKQAVKGFVLNRLKHSKKVASSQLLSGLSVKLVKRLEGEKTSLAAPSVVLDDPNALQISKEAEMLVDPVLQELKSVVANESLLAEVASVEEALECFEELKSSSSDSLAVSHHLKVEKRKLSRSLPSSPARQFGRRSSTGFDRFPGLDEARGYSSSNQLLQDLFVKASTLDEGNEIELDDQRISSEEQDASLSERLEPAPQKYPENAFVLSNGDGAENPLESSSSKKSVANKLVKDFLSLPFPHLLLLASIVIHNSPYLSSYYITLIFDAFIVAYVCQKLLLQREIIDETVQPRYHDTRLERATMTFESNNKTVSGSVKILKGKFLNDESFHSAVLVHARVEDHLLKIFRYNESEERELRIHEPLQTFYLCGATVSLVPRGLIRKRAFRKRFPICITLPYVARKSSTVSGGPSIDEETDLSPCNDGLAEAKKEKAIYLYTLTDREKEALFWALLENSKTCNKISLCSTSLQPSCSVVTPSVSYSSLLDSQSDQSLSAVEESIGKTKTTEVKPDTSPSLFFENYARSLIENYEREKEQYQRLEYFPAPNVDFEKGSCSTEWLNVVIGRLFYDFLTQKKWSDYVIKRIQRKLDVIDLPTFVESLKIIDTAMGDSIPQLHSVSDPIVDQLGIWFDFDFVYNGSFQMTLQAKTKMPSGINQESNDSLESRQNVDGTDTGEEEGSGSKSQSPTQSKLINKIEKWVSHKHFQTVAQSRFVKKYVGDFSNMTLTLSVEVKRLQGIMTFNIPPVPSDRIWYGFRNEPDLSLHAFPKVGTHQINLSSIVQMIERKLVQAFKKALVLPNMEDLVIPIMFSPIYDQ